MSGRLQLFSDVSGVYFIHNKIHRILEVRKRIPEELLEDQMKKILFHHSGDFRYVSVFEFQITEVTGRFMSENVFELSIETVIGLRNISGKASSFFISEWDDFIYEYGDVDFSCDENNEYEDTELGYWFDPSNVITCHHHSDVSEIWEVEQFEKWLFEERSMKTYSNYHGKKCSLFYEIWQWPVPLRGATHKSYYMLPTGALDQALYEVRGTNSSNAVEQLIVMWRFYLAKNKQADLRMLCENYDSIVEELRKSIPVDDIYVNRLRNYITQAKIYVEKYPNVLGEIGLNSRW